MPLYVDDEIIDMRMCATVASALKAIKYEMLYQAVTPSLALALIKKYFLPLLPIEHHDVFGQLTQVSWSRLSWGYSEMISRSFKAGNLNEILKDIGVSIDWVCRYTTLPPREPTVFGNLEANVFLQHCGFINVEIAHLRYLDAGKFDVFKACKYCWRQPVSRRTICVVHTASDKHSSIMLNNHEHEVRDSLFTDYKEGKRQKEAYDKTINQILTKETIAFHESSFRDPFLMPSEHIWSWLLERRPLVSKLLIEQKLTTGDDVIIDSLLMVLHSPTTLTDNLLKPYFMANQHIKRHPQLIWLMLLRAEAWLTVRSKRRGNWGGNRKLVISVNTSSQIPIKSKLDELFEEMEDRPINNFQLDSDAEN